MSLTRWWPILLVVLKVAMGNPSETVKEEVSHNPGAPNNLKENVGALRHIRAANQNGGGGLGLDDTSGGGYSEDPSDPTGVSTWGSEEELSSTTTAVVVPLSIFKILAPPDTLKYLRPITSKSVIENSAKWFLPPPSFNLMSGGGGGTGVGGGFPRYSRADSNFIRFGRSHNSGGYIGTNNKKNNFIRLGRENPRQNNFIRLGRSASTDIGIGGHQPFRFGKLMPVSTGYFPTAEGSLDGGPKRIALDSNDYGFQNDQNSLDSPHRLG